MANELTPEVKSKLLAARSFAQERKPEVARTILEATDHPRAREMLAKLPAKKQNSFPLSRLLTILGVLILVAGTAFTIGYASAPKETINVLFDYQPTETPTPNPDATQNPDHATMTAIAIENVTRVFMGTEAAIWRETEYHGLSPFQIEQTAVSLQRENRNIRQTEIAVGRETQTAEATLTAIAPENP